MSWQAASFGVLGLVLLGGFAWYERSRPPSQVVAVVAALAALGVAGRVALAAVPNVVATTDIALFAGFAFGAAPGFAVGALAALVSNFWLGQGPWTPWQMAAWGLCGIAGALLARASGRRMGRFGLAAACGVAGILFGALLNFSLMVTYGGEVSLERFVALESRAVPFDVAHAAGNVALALVAGPMMIRMLIRYRERFEWRRGTPAPGAGPPAMRPTLATLAIALGLGAAMAAPAAAAPRDAANWLAARQNSDGGFGASPGDESSPEMTGWAMLGLEAAGRNPRDVRTSGRTPVRYLRRNIGEITSSGDLARTILAVAGAELEPRTFGGRNLVAALRNRRRANGSFAGQVNLTAFAVMALRAAGARGGLARSLRWLHGAQNDDGGWGFTTGVASEADSTGAALQAVRASRAARRGARWLIRTQTRSGGWRIARSGPVNSQSTAWALQGLIAGGRDPSSVSRGGRDGIDYLLARQAPNGHIAYSGRTDQTPIWVTAQALVSLFGQSYPVRPVAPRPRDPDRGDNRGDGSGRAGAGSGGTGNGGGGTAGSGSGSGSGGSTPSAVAPATGSGSGSGTGGNASGRRGAEGGAGGEQPASGGGDNSGAPEPSAATPEAEGTLSPGTAGDGVVDAEPATGEEASADEAEDEPLAPLGVGLGTTMAVAFGVWWLARRNGW
jgi:energy-coupling factor transport system substrate-specific component